MKPVVAFCGAAGAGKSAAADALVDAGFARVKFAGFLKSMLRAFYRECGLAEVEIERRIEGDLKEVPDPLLGGKAPRFAMQTLGSEWGRDTIAPDLWVNAWTARASVEIAAGKNVVCDDTRFANECAAVQALGGYVVEITGRAKGIGTSHASEVIDFTSDMTLVNKGTEAEFKGAVAYIFGSESYE